MFGSSSSVRSDMKQAIKEILKELKLAGVRMHDFNKQQADALATLAQFPYLRPSLGVMPGSQVQHLKLEGTVQMFYQSNGYYVPLAVFLRADHPLNPPVCIVTPTPDMMIKPTHNHVDVQGIVYLPYLHTWDAKSSNIIGMIQALSAVFESSPFIFKRPTQQRPPPPGAQPLDRVESTATKESAPGKEGAFASSQQPASASDGGRASEALFSKPPSRPVPPPPALDLQGADLHKQVRDKVRENDALDEVLEDAFRCPISMEIMTDPVFATDGHTYERAEMERWLQTHTTSPLTNEVLPGKTLIPNHNLRSQIREYRERVGK